MADTFREDKNLSLPVAGTSFGVATAPSRSSDAVGMPGIIEKWGLDSVFLFRSHMGGQLGGRNAVYSDGSRLGSGPGVGHEANAGAVAFSRSGDPTLGEFEDAVILKTFGEVPEDFRQV
jgi:hypothetical protein